MSDSLKFGIKGQLYLQEGNVATYQIMLPFLSVRDKMRPYLPVDYGESVGYLKNNYGHILFYEYNMQAVVEAFLEKTKEGFPPEWEKEWKEIDENLTVLSFKIKNTDLKNLTLEELKTLYKQLLEVDFKMWAISIFIDVFDAGFDQKEIEDIAKKFNLDFHEVQMLLTPDQPSYINEWEQALYGAKTSRSSLDEVLNKFFWYYTTYTSWANIDLKTLAEKVKDAEKVVFLSPTKEQKEILKKHSLKNNPLEVFKILTVWRDQRKRLNFTGLYGLVKILREVLRRHNISPELVNGLLPTQVNDLFDGKIDEKTLKEQLVEGVLLHITPKGEYHFYFKEEANEKWGIILKHLHKDLSKQKEVKGMVASKGFARGVVRVIYNINEEAAKTMEEGDILVSSMTRPEFVPLMKKAGAIITDEGGISCHAAIVARELKKPCIIGTRNASRILKTGDRVEVDANQGIVRKLN